jgi:hypothetical protein
LGDAVCLAQSARHAVVDNARVTEQSGARSEAAQPRITAGNVEDVFSSARPWDEQL